MINMCNLEACKAFVAAHEGARGACLFENSQVNRMDKYEMRGKAYSVKNYGVGEGREYLFD